jgi:hypothetical protein
MRLIVRMLILGCALAPALGCRLFEPQAKGRSPLVPLASASNTLTLEIFSAPVPLGDQRLAALWQECDETSIPPEVRKSLSQNGIRAGIVGPHVPDTLAEMLKLTDERVTDRNRVPLEPEPGVVLRVLQPRPGHRNDLIIHEPHEQVSVFRMVDGQLGGRTYGKAECQMALRVTTDPDARVRLDLTPELHYGEVKVHAVGSDGMFMMKPERSKQVFSDLKLLSTLGAGQMLLLTCAPDKPGSVGHAFFADRGGEKPLQRLWVIRTAQAAPDRAFAEALGERPADVSSDTAE